MRYWAGGTCGNVLCILSWLGWDTYPLARLSGDAASERVLNDMKRWGVHVDWASCVPTAHTPMVVHEIILDKSSQARHRFLWSCPHCGKRLPRFKPITTGAVEHIRAGISNPSVFFFDRASRAILDLAMEASGRGAVVVFEPSSKAEGSLIAEAISLAHIVKYADGRAEGLCESYEGSAVPLVEVHTLGDRGLKYRHRLGPNGAVSDWIYQTAFPVPRVADSCGAGDWCTAGLISRTSVDGLEGLYRGGAEGIDDAMCYGQALAAWNCGFEGARGGMYAVDRKSFDIQINGLIEHGDAAVIDYDGAESPLGQIECPACSYRGNP